MASKGKFSLYPHNISDTHSTHIEQVWWAMHLLSRTHEPQKEKDLNSQGKMGILIGDVTIFLGLIRDEDRRLRADIKFKRIVTPWGRIA